MSARRIHLVGIGGAGMSGLARLAADAGYVVSGTDRADSSTLEGLRAIGVDARAGHGGIGLDGVDAVVVSTAIAAGNPDLLEAERRGISVIHRSELLAELMSTRRGLAVAGAHGKSTTSGMLVMALGHPSACVGATIAGGGGTGAIWGEPPWFVAEADESDRSLLNLRPEGAILLNVDHDHHTTYASIDEVMEVFSRFVALLPADGVLVVGPDPRAREVAAHASCEVREVRREAGGSCHLDIGVDGVARCRLPGEAPVTLTLSVPGVHNVENAACALTLAQWCGVPPALAAERLGAFTGVGRRFEHRATVGDVTIVDDYAHHPAEITATLSAARERHPGRVLAVFQPHLYSRTKALLAETAGALGAADAVVVTEIYAAREPFDPSVSGRDIVAAMDGRAVFAPSLEDAADAAVSMIRPGDLVLTLGAGDITTLCEDLATRLRTQS